jgi:osmotically-inducible protein OsmY
MADSVTVEQSRAQLYQRCSAVLADNPYLAKDNGVDVSTDDGRVTLHGKVYTFYQKQMAQEIIRRVDGVTEIRNQLEVHWS